jgi:hypothetical protein
MSRALDNILKWTSHQADQSWMIRTWHKSEDAEKIVELEKQLKDACEEFMVLYMYKVQRMTLIPPVAGVCSSCHSHQRYRTDLSL